MSRNTSGEAKKSERRLHCHSKAGSQGEGLLTWKALSQALWRQRALADRAESEFVFLRLRVLDGRHAGVCVEWGNLLAQAALSRCRSSDTPGWCDDTASDVGLILPEAPVCGALRVVQDVEAAFRERAKRQARHAPVPDVACELYVYPSQPQMLGLELPTGAPAPEAAARPNSFVHSCSQLRPDEWCED